MSSVDFIVIAVIVALFTLAIYKIVRDKKNGVKCSGCSDCTQCSNKSNNTENVAKGPSRGEKVIGKSGRR